MKPILNGAHFTPHSGVAFMTAFGSPIAAVAMISEFYGEGKIDQKETLLATVATWFPQTIYESLVYISPTIVPVLGRITSYNVCYTKLLRSVSKLVLET